MSYDPRRPPMPTETRENPAFTAWVERRAVELCTDAAPEHATAIPCSTHLQNARREGRTAWGDSP